VEFLRISTYKKAENISKVDNEVTIKEDCVGCGMCIDECENSALVVEG
jgi:ferredoxin